MNTRRDYVLLLREGLQVVNVRAVRACVAGWGGVVPQGETVSSSCERVWVLYARVLCEPMSLGREG